MNVVDGLESVLFAAQDPVEMNVLVQTMQLTEGQVAQALEILEARLEEKGGIQLRRVAGGYQLCTKPEFAEIVARLLKPQASRLSRSVMEVLAVVAYKQPVTLAEIEITRGVQSDYGLRMLIEKGLIEDVGRKDAPGRPVLYGTTRAFLHQFNLADLSRLPELPEGVGLGQFNVQ